MKVRIIKEIGPIKSFRIFLDILNLLGLLGHYSPECGEEPGVKIYKFVFLILLIGENVR